LTKRQVSVLIVDSILPEVALFITDEIFPRFQSG